MRIIRLGSNQVEIRLPNARIETPHMVAQGACVLVSYETPVAARIEGGLFYRTEKKFSRTTSRHITNWLSENNCKDYGIKPQSFFDNLLSATQ